MNETMPLQLEQVIAEYLAAVDTGHPPDRDQFIEQHPELAAELREFFHDQDRIERLAAPTQSRLSTDFGNPVASPRPAREQVSYFGNYELLTELARGGMGVVYQARQTNLDRIVALKMILAGRLASARDVQRFYQEAEAAATLDHPGIVPIFEVGQQEGQHFYSMAYVDGPNLARIIADGPLSPRDAALLVKLVAEAVAYAHDRQVIHRDLKPANVLLAPVEQGDQGIRLRSGTVPSAGHRCYQPRVTDFGLARRGERNESGLTGTGQILGTPGYMSPEQAAGQVADVGAVADVYSLGAILYATLTGHPPFQSDNPLQVVRQVLEQEPVSPRQLNPAVPRDLETICLKCLEKDRRKRYASARELAEELQRFLNGEPIQARRISGIERGWRWCRRQPALAGFWLTGLALLLALGIGGPALGFQQREIAERAMQLHHNAEVSRNDAEEKQAEAERHEREALQQKAEAEEQRRIAEAARNQARQNLVASQFLLGQIARNNGNTAQSHSWYLQAYLNSPPGDRYRRSARNLLGAWGSTLKHTFVHEGGVHTVGVSRDGRILMTGYFGSRARFWDMTTGKPLGEPMPHAGDLVSIEVSPDGKFALTGDWEGAKVWDVATGKLRYPMLAHEVREDTVVGPVLSPDARTIVTRTPYEGIRLWDAETGKPRTESLAHGGFVYAMIFSPDSKLVASLGETGGRIWNAETGEPLGEAIQGIQALAFHPDSSSVATCKSDGTIQIIEARTGKQLLERKQAGLLRDVQYDASGRHLLTQGEGQATLWLNVAAENPEQRALPHGHGLFAASFSPDGKSIFAASYGALKVWAVDKDQPLWERQFQVERFDRSSMIKSVVFNPDSQSLLVITQGNVARVLNAGTGQVLAQEEGVIEATCTRDGRQLIVGSSEGWARVRAIHSTDPRLDPVIQRMDRSHQIHTLALSPDGAFAVTAGYEEKTAKIWNMATWEFLGVTLEHELPVTALGFSPDSTLVTSCISGKRETLFGQPPGQLMIWKISGGKPVGDAIPLKTAPYPAVFDSTGETVYAGQWLCDVKTRRMTPLAPSDRTGDTRTIAELIRATNPPVPKLWDATKDEPARLQLPERDITQAILTQDGRRLVGVRQDGQARLWDAQSREPLGPWFDSGGALVKVSPDGRYVLTSSSWKLELWDAMTGRPCGDPLLREIAHIHSAFSPEGDILATQWNFHANFWDSATGQMLGPPLLLSTNGGTTVMFTPDGKKMLIPARRLYGWTVPQPAVDDPARLQLSVEVRTGLYFSDNGALQKLRPEEWHNRRQQLEKLGGPCDVPTP